MSDLEFDDAEVVMDDTPSHAAAAAASSSSSSAGRKRKSHSGRDAASSSASASSPPHRHRARRHLTDDDDDADQAEEELDDASFDVPAMSESESRAFRHSHRSADGAASTSPPPPLPLPDQTIAAPAGILLSMELKNFMNFRHFSINFNSNLNFIHGANGAGKSSILHAIQLVFGAKAADTSRGRNIALLIQNGRDHAELTVRIKNEEGPFAFKHAMYGDVITVTRHLRRTGKDTATSQYLMSGRSASGRVASTKATRDVHEMCEHFNIQVSNPCVVMTQEVSKKFLQSKKADDKYAFFLKATQLDGLREQLRDAHTKVRDMSETVQVQQGKLPDLERRIEQLKKTEKLAQEAEEMERDIQVLADQMAWRKVKDLEIRYDELEMQHHGLKSELASKQHHQSQVESSVQSHDEWSAELSSHRGLLERHASKKASLVDEVGKCNNDILSVKQEQRHITGRIATEKKRLAAINAEKQANEAKIDEIAARNSRDTSEVDAARQKKRSELDEEKSTLTEERKRILVDIAQLHDQDVSLRTEESELVETTTQANQKVNRSANQLAQLERESGGEAAAAAAASSRAAAAPNFNPVFGQFTGDIWRAIGQCEWEQKPIGPLGEYVQVRPESEKWLPAVTECLTGKEMSTFVVDNFRDQAQLQRIFESVCGGGWKPNIIRLQKRARYPVVKPRVPFPLVIDCLQIDDEWAFNATVFLCKIERYGLHQDAVQAADAIRPFRAAQSGGGNDFVLGSFLPDGSRVRILGASAQGSTISQAPVERPMFRVSRADAIKELRATLAHHQGAFDDLRRQCAEKAAEVKSVQARSTPLKRRKAAIDARLREIDNLIADLEYEADRARLDLEQIDDTPLVEEGRRLVNEAAEVQARIDELEASDSAEFGRRIDAIKSTIDQLNRDADDIGVLAAQEEAWIEKAVRARAKQDVVIRRLRDELHVIQERLASCEAKYSAVSAELSITEAQAEAQCPERNDSNESLATLSAKHDIKFNTLQEKRHRQPINIESVRMDLHDAELQKLDTEQQMLSVRGTLDRLDLMNKARQKRMLAMRKSMADSANHAFSYLLQPQGAQGRLIFDHRHQTLEMVVNPNTRDADRQDAANTVALSGGERSVTTIAFVMAIGEQVECPFRAIDEFDVFMDAQNRRVSMQLLLSIAKRRKDRQYFFLSPLDVHGLQPNPYFTVHKLTDPERNQATIPFQAERTEAQ